MAGAREAGMLEARPGDVRQHHESLIAARVAAENRTTMGAHARITTPFNDASTADDVVAGVDLTGRCAIVTCGASGIGAETARALASAGAAVTLAVRNTQAAEHTAADMRLRTGNGRIIV